MAINTAAPVAFNLVKIILLLLAILKRRYIALFDQSFGC
jgi:hypothetical protein